LPRGKIAKLAAFCFYGNQNRKGGKKVHKGKIKKLVRDRGFGFIDDTDGREVFFHQSSLVDTTFNALKDDAQVEFEVETSDKGPRATNVRVVA